MLGDGSTTKRARGVTIPDLAITTFHGIITNIFGGYVTPSRHDRTELLLDQPAQLFGSRNRTAVLVALRLLEESYPSELARLLGLRLYSVQQILRSFEIEGVIVSRMFGRTRRVTWNPRYVGHTPLADLLWKIGQEDVPLQRALAGKRRRPRRAGKPGL